MIAYFEDGSLGQIRKEELVEPVVESSAVNAERQQVNESPFLRDSNMFFAGYIWLGNADNEYPAIPRK